ncbi:MAG: hypothetical protein IIU05_07020, partial [Bacteroidales bacterium]|nr:hypothetical protein [Bacteroidales bacterium]
ITFLFISFTRLFFRSGSNLNPAEANEVAWRTASQMVDQMGSHWNLAQIPQIVGAYWNIFLIFAIGMQVRLQDGELREVEIQDYTQSPS